MIALSVSLSLSLATTGCAIRTTRARDATLHYHPTLDELKAGARTAPAQASRPGGGAVQIEAFASGYPQPVGLDYSNGGAFRKVVGVEWSAGELEAALVRHLRDSFGATEVATNRLGGGVVSLAVYRFGSTVFASALLEVRLVRNGDEVFASRYRASARGPDRGALLDAIARDLSNQIAGDHELLATTGGAP
jgi:hypothetical protein